MANRRQADRSEENCIGCARPFFAASLDVFSSFLVVACPGFDFFVVKWSPANLIKNGVYNRNCRIRDVAPNSVTANQGDTMTFGHLNLFLFNI
jgi:hypothetical protein